MNHRLARIGGSDPKAKAPPRLANTGLGLVDAGLLAATLLTPGAALWARDKTLRAAAGRCGVDAGLG